VEEEREAEQRRTVRTLKGAPKMCVFEVVVVSLLLLLLLLLFLVQ
jgi:uncharacterized integral membrane protein